MFETWDELSPYKMRSPGGAGVKGPFKTGANEVAEGRAVLVGAEVGFAVRATGPAGGGYADTATGATMGQVLFNGTAVE